MKKTIIYYLPLVFFGLLAVTSCGKKEEPAVQEQQSPAATATAATVKGISLTDDQFKLAGIQTGSIESRSLSSIIKMTGVIDAEPGSTASVSAPLGGYIKTAGLLPGQPVKKGQVLASLENPEFISLQQQYLEGTGRLEYLEQEYKRQQVLRDEDINAAKTFQLAGSELKIMRAKVSGLEQQLGFIGISASALKKSGRISRTASLYAPVSGYIKTSNTGIGKYVSPTDVLFEISGTSDLHLALNAFEKDLGKIRTGQNVKFSLSNENKYDRNATVYLVGQAADDNKIIPVHCHLGKQTGLLPGMFVKALVETGSEKQNAVPSDAIVQFEGSDYIIIQKSKNYKGYSFELIQVSKGIEQGGYTAVEFAGATEASQFTVVTKNAYTILSAIKNAEEEE